LFLIPSGAGDKSGSSWDNALDQSMLSSAVNEMLKPGDILRLGSGVYPDASLPIKQGGLKDQPVRITGVDRGDGLPLFQATWSADKPDKGATAISIDSGVSNLILSGLRLDGYVFGIQARDTKGQALRTDLVFQNIAMADIRHGFYLSDCCRLLIEDCVLRRYTKHGYRLEGGCSDVAFKGCIADCSEGDAEWEKKTELFPFGFLVNNKGAGCTGITFEDCLAANNLMPLQKTRYKNGDGFVVEEKTSAVSFTRCRAINNQDGGFDLKVPDVKLQDCVALRNSRNFRIWNTGTLKNCIAVGGKTGLWCNGGPLSITRSTFCNLTGAAVETDDRASAPITLTGCLISDTGKTTHHTSKGTADLKECIVVGNGSDSKDPAFVRSDPKWDGIGDAMNSRTYPDKGYRGK
jgi:hypothetical protein